jgi:hypothetical protein
MVGGSLRVLRHLPPLKLVAIILLKVALSTKNQSGKVDLVSRLSDGTSEKIIVLPFEGYFL